MPAADLSLTVKGMKHALRILAGLFAVGLSLVMVPVEPAHGGDCLDQCRSSKGECDSRNDRTRLTCMVTCGVPMLPGYGDCKSRCDDDYQTRSLQCVAEQKACEIGCRVPK